MGRKRRLKTAGAGGWSVTFADDVVIETGYYPNPRMAVGYAVMQYREQFGRSPPKIKRVKWRS